MYQCFSGLDAESEILAQEGLNAAMQGRTTLIIAHRLATVKKVSRIIVLNQGRIVEIGSPEVYANRAGFMPGLPAYTSTFNKTKRMKEKGRPFIFFRP
jgi:ABC-type multidrug transport system fused ATPase/permease subunit